jgi:hypothetical protein
MVLVRIDVSKELRILIVKVTKIGELGTALAVACSTKRVGTVVALDMSLHN